MSQAKPASQLVGEWLDFLEAPAPSRTLTAAIAYARHGWPVFPVTVRKVPLTERGLNDATLDASIIRAWWKRWPDALVSIATGKTSGIVALDVDIKNGGSGLDSLEEIGVTEHPKSPTAHSPSGGYHILFAHPGFEIRNSTGIRKSSTGKDRWPLLDVRGDGGGLILPPGPGRRWDPHLGPSTPLAAMPAWLMPPADPAPRTERPRPVSDLSPYARAALDGAAKRIIGARAGEQETTLNAECFAIGQLAGGGVIVAGTAIEGLLWAARRMPSHDPRRPWRPAEVERKVKAAFTDGLQEPRTVPNGGR